MMANRRDSDSAGGHDGFSDSDQQWFDRLTGRSAAVSDAAVSTEADALREAVLREHARELAEDATTRSSSTDEQRRQQLLFVARKSGLLGTRTGVWRGWTWIGAVAATVLLGVLAFDPSILGGRGGYAEPPEWQMRGAEALVSISDPDPQARAEGLAAALKAAGATVGIYAKGAVYTVDVDVEPEHADAVMAAATRQGIALRPDYTRVRITKR